MNILKKIITPIVREVLLDELTNINKRKEKQPSDWANVCSKSHHEQNSAAKKATEYHFEEIASHPVKQGL